MNDSSHYKSLIEQNDKDIANETKKINDILARISKINGIKFTPLELFSPIVPPTPSITITDTVTNDELEKKDDVQTTYTETPNPNDEKTEEIVEVDEKEEVDETIEVTTEEDTDKVETKESKENSDSTIKTTSSNDGNVLSNAVKMDADWWNTHYEEIGAIKDGNTYTLGTFTYKPNEGYLSYTKDEDNYIYKGGRVNATFYICGEISDVYETTVCLKGSENYPLDNVREGQIIVFTDDVNNQISRSDNPDPYGDCQKIAAATVFANDLATSGGANGAYVNTVAGFSMGGQNALEVLCADKDGDGSYDFQGLYQEVTLVNISPGNNGNLNRTLYGDNSPLDGMKVNIYQTYNNTKQPGYANSRNFTQDYYGDGNVDKGGCTSNYGAHLENIANHAEVEIFIPDTSKDRLGYVSGLRDEAERLSNAGLDVTVTELSVDDSTVAAWSQGNGVGHTAGNTVIDNAPPLFKYIF